MAKLIKLLLIYGNIFLIVTGLFILYMRPIAKIFKNLCKRIKFNLLDYVLISGIILLHAFLIYIQ